ncbi:lysophospholipase L1-like esterase [Amycolatopsis lexingtonensis]|uniref:Lysophospholipase L1-like esterase n=1 Tax=Amycolatopsis lexingtonensis TaxID=218822 RepID=A0ABR9HWF9_9PSEU|nr:SGNH/GDSL hydrolase family protein [Amycolatopsis lexingtonensis]MBE1495270.1 lysophospholipase L1-like esterase [Amycolatopsis lexingtonensis]
MRRFLAVSAAILAGFGLLTTAGSANPESALPNLAQHSVGGWVGTWAAAPASAVANTPDGYPGFSIRNVVHTSAGGGRARVHLSNAFGAAPLTFGHVTLAVQSDGPDAVPGTLRELTFGGAPGVVVPAGAEALSDPAELRVPADANLLVTTYVPTKSGPVTYHPAAAQTSYFTRAGDFAASESGVPYTEQTSVWHYVSGVDVQGGAEASIVALGDSITDGVGSQTGANHRWPDYLADRLHGRFGVLNAGISANRLLLDVPGSGAGQNALSRFDRDVLSVGGVRTLIVLEGINDIQQTPHQTDPDAITSAYRQLVAQAHARGIRVVGATLTPFKGWRVYDETLEATRQAVNAFIRTGGVFDAVADFDAAVRDPADPLTLLPAYDSGDHLHPGDAGYERMAAAVRLDRL